LDGHSCTLSNNVIYCVGGSTSAPPYNINGIYYSPISSTGVGAWSKINNYPANVAEHSCVSSNDTIYCVGGMVKTCSNNLCWYPPINSTYYAPISSTGIGTWTSATDYPVPIEEQVCKLFDNNIYCIGGTQWVDTNNAESGQYEISEVYYAPVSSTGVGIWTSTTDYPLSLAYFSCTLGAAQGFAPSTTTSTSSSSTSTSITSTSSTTSTSTTTLTPTLYINPWGFYEWYGYSYIVQPTVVISYVWASDSISVSGSCVSDYRKLNLGAQLDEIDVPAAGYIYAANQAYVQPSQQNVDLSLCDLTMPSSLSSATSGAITFNAMTSPSNPALGWHSDNVELDWNGPLYESLQIVPVLVTLGMTSTSTSTTVLTSTSTSIPQQQSSEECWCCIPPSVWVPYSYFGYEWHCIGTSPSCSTDMGWCNSGTTDWPDYPQAHTTQYRWWNCNGKPQCTDVLVYNPI
jgi:hypothetical protein